MNDIFSRFGLSQPPKFIKILVLGFLAIIAFAFIWTLMSSTMHSVFPGTNPLSSFMARNGLTVPSPYLGGVGMGMSEPAADYNYTGSTGSYAVKGVPSLSIQNVASIRPVPPIIGGGTTGDTAEDYEVSDYSASIETGNADNTCASVKGLKAKSYVIFENANESDTSCSYSFKVKHENVDEVLTFIKDLNPKDLSENTYTIKRQIDDYTSEEQVLKNKRTSIEKTLTSALAAYDDVTNLATRTGDADALAKIIDSRVQVIERLTEENIAVNEQLDRLSRSKADQLDRLDYTYFSVSVYENKFFDGKSLGDSWKEAIKTFVTSINIALQAATVGLIGFLLALIPFILYFFVLLFIAKVGWNVTKRIWNK